MKRSKLLLGLIVTIIATVAAQGQGIIIPRPCRPERRCPPPPPMPRPIPQSLKLKSIHLSTKITEQVATTHVVQVFENDTPYMLEGTYFFPLPDNVSITEFAMWDGNKRLVGEVRSREEARRIYDEIVRSRRDPALLEYAGKNLFQASVFPIGPHSEKKIELTYSQTLIGEGGAVSYRYPLGTGWRANGFFTAPIRPMPMPMPRMEGDRRIQNPNPGAVAGARISAEIEISSRTPIKSVYSPSHAIEVNREGERKARLSFESKSSSAQPDFILYYSFSEQDFGLSLLTHREPGKDGFFMLLVSPKATLDPREVADKEVIFVLDTSGSMAEDGKMEKAKAAMRFGVNSLNPRDRFNMISFAGEEHLLSESLIAADGNGKKQALEFIERMKATGGTNINDAVLAALKQAPQSDRSQIVVLITDGQPTVGETRPEKILSNAKAANKSSARLFTFGVGYDINTIVLDGLANENRGAAGYIEPNEDLEVKISNFFAKVNNPVLSDVKIDWGGVQTELIYPKTYSDIFHGSQLALLGRYRPSGKSSASAPSKNSKALVESQSGTGDGVSHRLVLTGKVNGKEKRFTYDGLKFPEKQSGNEFLPNLWAMRRIGHLMDQIRVNGESKELRDEIVELGTRYGIVTPYTSNLVLEPGMVAGGIGRERAGQTSETVVITGGRPAPPAKRAPGSPRERDDSFVLGGVGQGAVNASKQKEELRGADKLYLSSSENLDQRAMRQVAAKTFYLQGETWTDSEFMAGRNIEVVNLKFASDEYFNILKAEPKLSDYFSLGKRIVVVWNGKVYRVEE